MPPRILTDLFDAAQYTNSNALQSLPGARGLRVAMPVSERFELFAGWESFGPVECQCHGIIRNEHCGANEIIGRCQTYCALCVLVNDREVLQVRITIFDRTTQGDREKQLVEGGRYFRRREKIADAFRDVFIRTVIPAMRAQSIQHAEVFHAEIGTVRAQVEPLRNE